MCREVHILAHSGEPGLAWRLLPACDVVYFEFVHVEAVTVPGRIAPGAATRAHLVMRPNLARKAHWSNEVENLVVWVNPPAGWQVDPRSAIVPGPEDVVSQEPRRVEFELHSPADDRGESTTGNSYRKEKGCGSRAPRPNPHEARLVCNRLLHQPQPEGVWDSPVVQKESP